MYTVWQVVIFLNVPPSVGEEEQLEPNSAFQTISTVVIGVGATGLDGSTGSDGLTKTGGEMGA